MREFAVAITLSVFVVGVTLILPYSVSTAHLPQTVAVRETASVVGKQPEASSPARTHGHVQTAQATVTAGDPEQGRQVYRKCLACHSLEAGKNALGPSLAGIIGKKVIFDRVYNMGDLQSPPARGVQTVTVPAGGATIVEFKLDVPGNYILVDHALSRAERGLVGILQAEGPANAEIFDGKVEVGGAH
jgi:hypothetical protein